MPMKKIKLFITCCLLLVVLLVFTSLPVSAATTDNWIKYRCSNTTFDNVLDESGVPKDVAGAPWQALDTNPKRSPKCVGTLNTDKKVEIHIQFLKSEDGKLWYTDVYHMKFKYQAPTQAPTATAVPTATITVSPTATTTVAPTATVTATTTVTTTPTPLPDDVVKFDLKQDKKINIMDVGVFLDDLSKKKDLNKLDFDGNGVPNARDYGFLLKNFTN